MINHLSTMRETRVQSLGWEDTLEKEMETHSSTTAWKIPWTEEPDRLQSMGSQRVGHDWAASLSLCPKNRGVFYFKAFKLGNICQVLILKSRDIIFPTKVHIVKAMVFLVVEYGRESWTIKKAEHQRIDAIELLCWRRFLRVPWSVRKSNQSILKEINTEYSLEALMLRLKLQYLGHLMWRADWLEKTLMLGKIEDKRKRGWDGWMASPTWWTWVWATSRSWWRTRKPGELQSMVRKSQTQLSNWTELRYMRTFKWLEF